MSKYTPRRLARPSLQSSAGNINTASSPNLGSVFTSLQPPANLVPPNTLPRKSSLNALTSHSLNTIPDASDGYGLSTVLDEDFAKMPPSTPTANRDGELDVGDLVDVPGGMHGTVRFVGSVQGKKGTFAGVELSEEFAARGKNSGDVDGVSYFTTAAPGAGIFLPLNRATRRGSPSSHEGSYPLTPPTPSTTGGLNIGRAQSTTFTPPTPSASKFSQSVGPGARAPSPQNKKARPSLPRPESPLRKQQLGARPSLGTIGTPAAKTPQRYASPVPNKLGQSVRGTQDSRDPAKKPSFASKNGIKGPANRSASALGNNPLNYSDEDNTPRTANNGSMGSISSFNAKMRPASRADNEEVDRLRGQLEERDRQLRDQASTLAEMESSLNEVQSLMAGPDSGSRMNRSSMEDKDATQMRAMLREKNEKIAMLTAEFDAHRADFRSTIDTLELASTETERVYEKKVEDLLQELRDYQDRNEDVDSVARQLKQLEELVQELEDGLEDARRGEAEARGEVEFLRGEVERTRSELRRERDKAATAGGVNGDSSTMYKEVEQRDDEIRGLKAIIHSLSRDAVPEAGSPDSDLQKTPTQRGGAKNGVGSIEDRIAREKLEREVSELRALVDLKVNREDELERELEQFRRGGVANGSSQRASGTTIGSAGTVVQDRSSMRDSKGTVVSWRDRERERDLQRSPDIKRSNTKQSLETMPESDAHSSASANESFCELCETSGHDILTCTNMFSPNGSGLPGAAQRNGRDVVKEGLKVLAPVSPQDGEFKPAPLSPAKKSQEPTPVRIIPNPMESGPVAGKESGVINMDKWCGVCEREGHDSIDCPFEDAF